MLVKCRICGNKTDKSAAYKVTNNSVSLYYCSEKEYLDYTEKKEKAKKIKNEIYDCISDIFGYKVINTALFSELSGICEVYSYEDIYYYLNTEKEYLSKCLAKEFTTEYARIRYFSAIICNRIKDSLNIKSGDIIKEYSQNSDFKYSPRKKRNRNIKEKEDNYIEDIG